MNKKHVVLLSISTAALLLSGCQERGKAIPVTPQKPVKKSKVVKIYDFPVLKLSANDDINNTETTSRTPIFPKITTKEDASENIPKVSPNPMTKDKKVLQQKARNKVIAETEKLKRKNKSKLSKKKKNNHTKRRATRSSSSSQIPIIGSLLTSNISLQDIPIINKLLPESSTASKGRIKAHTQRNTLPHSQGNRSISTRNGATPYNSDGSVAFSGGISSSNLDMAKIRVETDNYQTNIILDSYKWAGYNSMPTEVSTVSGQYFFRYEPSSHRIIGDIRGYNSFSALVKKQDILLQDNPLVKNIYLDRYIGDNGIQFIIELKQDVKVNIIDVEDPGSIIIELYPKKRNVVYKP